jgi:hypothetical protein
MIEKGFEVGIAESFGGLLSICGQFGKKSKDIVRCYGLYLPFTEFDLKIVKDVTVITQCIFF